MSHDLKKLRNVANADVWRCDLDHFWMWTSADSVDPLITRIHRRSRQEMSQSRAVILSKTASARIATRYRFADSVFTARRQHRVRRVYTWPNR
jgi:hypothetical protein